MTCKLCGNPESIPIIIADPAGKAETLEICQGCLPKYIQQKIDSFPLESLVGFPPVNPIEPIKSKDYSLENMLQDAFEINNILFGKQKNKNYGNPSIAASKNYYKEEVKPPCPKCGTDRLSFMKSGKPGCGFCYTYFPEVLPLIEAVQEGENRHRGKLHKKYFLDKAKNSKIKDLIKELEQEMAPYISREEYELAIPFRDAIRKIKQLAFDLDALDLKLQELVQNEEYESASESKKYKQDIENLIAGTYADMFLNQKAPVKELDVSAD